MIKRIGLALAGAAVLAALPAHAQPGQDGAYDLASVHERPRALNVAELAPVMEALYPAAQRNAGVTGRVVVQVVVDSTGAVRAPMVVDASDSAFVAPTLAVVRALRFSPATRDGRPVAARLQVPIAWQAAPPEPPAAADESAGAADEAPVLVNPGAPGSAMRMLYPQLLFDAGVTGSVRVRFVVGEDGTTRDVRILSSSHRDFNAPSLRVIQRLRFRPAMRDGRPVAAEVTRTLNWEQRASSLQ